MDDLEKFIQKFGGVTEEYLFYNGTVTLRYDPKDHVYLLVTEDGTLEVVDGVTTVCHIIDKSKVLIPWACKMMQQKLIDSLLFYIDNKEPNYVVPMDVMEELIRQAKKAHKEKLDEAGNIGSIAHAWIEQYIKAKLAEDEALINHLLLTMPDDEKAKNACIAALDWMGRHNVRWIHTERKIYHRYYKYAGTMDGLCLVDSCNNPLCCPHAFKDRLSVADWKTSNYLYPEYLMQTAAYMAAYVLETGELVQDRWIIRLGKEDAKFEVWHLEHDTYQEDMDAFVYALNLKRKFESIESRVSSIKDVYKKAKKHDKQKDLAKKCKGADKYQGKKKPRCNGGNPCEFCLNKYQEVQQAKLLEQEELDKAKKAKKHKMSTEEIVKSLNNLLTPSN